MYTVEPADLDRDRGAILRVWTDNFVHATEARFDWIYGRRALGEPSCVLLRTGADACVGTNTLLPRTVLWGGVERVIGQAVDLAVDREHRAAGPAIQLQKGVLERARECGMPAVYGFPLPAAEALLRRVGYRRLGLFRHWVKPLRRGGGTGPAGSGARAFYRIIQGRVADALHPLPHGWRVGGGGDATPMFDPFWREAAAQFDVVGERGAEFLRARFLASPKGDYRLFWLEDADHRLMGYVLFDRRRERVAKIVDALALTPPAWVPLLAAFSRHARREGAARIDFPLLAPAWLEAALARAGFRARRRPGERANNNVMLHQDAAAAPTLSGQEAWFLTFADTDAD